jgi:hypothetical protein
MSHTDKDRPEWVIRHTENFPIRHNHERGECITSTIEYARNEAAGLYKGYRHTCKKRIVHEYYCTKDNPYHISHYRWRNGGFWKPSGENICWGEWEVPVGYPSSRQGTRTKRNGCLGPHKRWTFHEEIPCTCDDWPASPTCSPEWYGAESGWHYPNIALRNKNKTEWAHVLHHRPERRRERDELRTMAKEYNANLDLEDWDFEDRQNHGSVTYHMC